VEAGATGTEPRRSKSVAPSADVTTIPVSCSVMSSEKMDESVRASAARCDEVHAGAGVAVGRA
jgi:hypothetical protein